MPDQDRDFNPRPIKRSSEHEEPDDLTKPGQLGSLGSMLRDRFSTDQPLVKRNVEPEATPEGKPIAITPPEVIPNPVQPVINEGPKTSPAEHKAPVSHTNHDSVAPGDTNIAININLPKIHRPHLPKLPYKMIGFVLLGLLIFVLVLWGGYHLFHGSNQKQGKQTAYIRPAATHITYSKPDFSPVAPASEATLLNPGHGAIFDGVKDTYSYEDKLDNVEIIVSEQPIPSNFSSAKVALLSIAKSINAATLLVTKSSTGYLATDTVSNQQTVVYTLDNLLIFIQSPFTHPTSAWIGYLNSLAT